MGIYAVSLAHKSKIHPAVARCRISEIESVCSVLKMYVHVSYDLKLAFTTSRRRWHRQWKFIFTLSYGHFNEYFYSARKFSTKHTTL